MNWGPDDLGAKIKGRTTWRPDDLGRTPFATLVETRPTSSNCAARGLYYAILSYKKFIYIIN